MAPASLLLDIDGVLTVGWEPLPHALDTFYELRDRGIPFRLSTNTTSRSRADLASILCDAGFDVAPTDLLTAAVATASHLQHHHSGDRVFVLSAGDLSADFEGIDTVDEDSEADVVVLGGAGLVYTHEQLNHAFQLILDGADFVAMHRNLYWRTARGMELDTGAYAMALEAATGVTPTLIGKPSKAFFVAGIDALGTEAADTMMVGDDVVNDVIGAQHAGLVGCLVHTGKYRASAVAAADEAPDFEIADLGELLPRFFAE